MNAQQVDEARVELKPIKVNLGGSITGNTMPREPYLGT